MKRLFWHWESLGMQRGFWATLVRYIIYAILLFFAFECVTLDFGWAEQAVLAFLTVILGYAIHRISDSELITLALMFASMLATARYAYWRIVTVAGAVTGTTQKLGVINTFFVLLLFSAELYAFIILFLGYIQTIRPLRRPPYPMTPDIESWPHVDLLIPTYNEPLSVVRGTIFGAMNIDYPVDKLHVYVLDDGRREEFRQFCEEAGVGYMTRPDNKHAKAGNINHALSVLDSPYVAIFDCDHVPTRSFLQMTLGWFLKEPKLGMLQTPHYFYSPDPFEKNLKLVTVPNEGELFYGVIQDGNDLWNATFFCGSCAVLRRTAMNEIGGIATETVTEDAHTSLRMQTRGWSTAYINIPQAAGLATESLSSHVGQRIRWARGMIQVMRTDNPLTVPGLTRSQRLCYFNAMIHFLYAVPRLIFLTAPLVYMLLGCINIPGSWLAILMYAMPHLFLSNVTNFRVQGKYRYAFWNEVYETVLAPYILGPTLLAMINPKLGKFNVTAKGGIVKKSYFDARIARPYIVLLLLNVAGLLIAPVRFFYWNANHPGTIAMNVFWILFNTVIVGTANAVAHEAKQTRGDVRVDTHMPVEVILPDGRRVFGETINLSMSGAGIQLEQPIAFPPGTQMRVIYPMRGERPDFPASVVEADGTKLRIRHDNLSLAEEELLTLALYSRADSWLTRSERRVADRPWLSFLRLVQFSVKGVWYALASLIPKRKESNVPATAMLLFALLLGTFTSLAAQPRVKKTAPDTSSAQPAAGGFNSSFTLKDVGIPTGIIFRGVDSSRNIPFALPQNEIAQKAVLHLHYSFSPGLIPQMSHLNVFLNGILISALAMPEKVQDVEQELNTDVPLPAEMLVRNNVLGFQFIGHYTQKCEDPSNTALWGRVENLSSIEVSGTLLQLSDDLKMLPLPFYDGAISSTSAAVPFALTGTQPSNKMYQAAGIVASWFGVLSKSRPLTFPVTVGNTLPKGNVVVFAENDSDLPPELSAGHQGPTIMVRTNPVDPYGKVLIIAGDTGDELVTAAQALVTGNSLLQGATSNISNYQLPRAREADDAPLWLRTDKIAPFWDYSDAELQSDGSGPLAVYLRVPPDLYYGDKQNLPLHMDYRYNPIPLSNGSTMRITSNGSLVNELPLPHADVPKKTLAYDAAVPVVNMRPFANTFLFNFYFQLAKAGYCQDTAPINLQGAILRSSYLDIRGLNHWAALPNLELFSNAGFPFTRFADLSQTRIVLPPRPTAAEAGAYLALLAHFGEQTGYPALRVTTGDASLLNGDADYLILGTPTDQPAFAQLNKQLTVEVQDRGFTIHDTGGFFSSIEHAWWQVSEMRPRWWWKLEQAQQRDGLLQSLGQFPDALVQGIESPWSSNRSIVSITFRDDSAIGPFISAFQKSITSSAISESVSVLHGQEFTSYRLGDRYYHVGYLPIWSRIRYWLRTFPWMIVVLTFILGLFVVPWIRGRLDRRAADRLRIQKT